LFLPDSLAGILVHRSPRFAGSFLAAFLASPARAHARAAALSDHQAHPPLKDLVTRRVSIRTLLAWHIYTGALGPISGHIAHGPQFGNAVGIALTAMSCMVV